jgi:hypothetical protein
MPRRNRPSLCIARLSQGQAANAPVRLIVVDIAWPFITEQRSLSVERQRQQLLHEIVPNAYLGCLLQQLSIDFRCRRDDQIK